MADAPLVHRPILKNRVMHHAFLRMMHSGASAILKNRVMHQDVFKGGRCSTGASAILKKHPLHHAFLRMMHSGASAHPKNLLCITRF